MASRSAAPGYVNDENRENSLHTIEANSEGEMGGVGHADARSSPRNGGGPNTGAGEDGMTGTYLDQYIRIEREERATNRLARATDESERERQVGVEEQIQRDGANETTDRVQREEDAKKVASEGVVGAGAAAAAVATPAPKLPARDLDPTKPRSIALTYTPEEEKNGRQHFFDFPDPAFYLGAAVLIGCICLFTWMADFIFYHGHIRSKYLWSITGGCTGIMLIAVFIYYCVTSKHYHPCGKIWDGFCGSFPCAVAAFGIVFVEAFGIELVVNTALAIGGEPKRDEFLIFGTVPIFLLIFFPVFFAMIKYQDKASQEARRKDPAFAANNYETQPITSSGIVYLVVMMRRVIVGWVCGVCVAAHIALPAYALSWLAYGLYDLQRKEGIWVIFVILIPPILIIVILAIIPFTRPAPLLLWTLVVHYFWYPLMSWDPREGGFWYRYDNGVTYERLVNEHNYEIQKAEAAYAAHNDAEAEKHYKKATETRALINERGVKYGVVDYATGKVVPASDGKGVGGGPCPELDSPADEAMLSNNLAATGGDANPLNNGSQQGGGQEDEHATVTVDEEPAVDHFGYE